MSTGDEIEAISRSRQGDVRAFNLLVTRYQGEVYGVCYRLLGDENAAEDTCQEVFLSAFRGIGGYRGGSFLAWLLRIAMNECYRHLHAGRQQTSIDPPEDALSAASLVFEDQYAAPEHVPHAELARVLERELLALPADERLVVVLRDVQGYSYPEIVAATGWPIGTIKSRLSRGRLRLRAGMCAANTDPPPPLREPGRSHCAYVTQQAIAMTMAFVDLRLLQVLMALLAWAWSFYCFGSVAAASNGQLDVTLAVGGALTLPVVILSGLRFRRRQALPLTMLLLLSALGLALAWLHLEAHSRLAEARRERAVKYVQRAWPFANSAVAYSPERGMWWDD